MEGNVKNPDIAANTSSKSKDSSNNKSSTQAKTDSNKPQKTYRTVVIDYGEHHRMSMREKRPLNPLH